MLSVINNRPIQAVVNVAERSKNCAIKYTTKIISPIKPFGVSVKIVNKSLAVANLITQQKYFPAFSRSMEGAADILGLAGFGSFGITAIPYLTKDNLDESTLRTSLLNNEGLDIEAIVATVKTTLDKSNNTSDIRQSIYDDLIKNNVAQQLADRIANCEMVICQKPKSFIENFILYTGLIGAANGAATTLVKMGADFSYIIAKIGQTKIGALIVKIGARRIALVFTFASLIAKTKNQYSKVCELNHRISEAKEEDKEKLNLEKTKAIWTGVIAGAKIIQNGVPLLFVATPVGAIVLNSYDLLILLAELREVIGF